MDTLKSSGIDCIEVNTTGSVADALTRYFRYRETRSGNDKKDDPNFFL